MKTINQNISIATNASLPNLLSGRFQASRLIFAVLFFFASTFSSNAAQRTWTGGTSTDWNTASNWSGSTTPISTDTVIIQTGTFNCLLAANTTIKQFTLTSDTIDLNGYTLTVTNNATTTAGLITNGTFTINGSGTVTFNGGTISVTVNATAASIKFSGGTFNNVVTAVKKGSTSSTGNGGCTFASDVTLIDSSTANWTFANTTADTWSGKVVVKETSSGTIYFAHNNATANSFSKSVTLTNTSTGNINCDYYGNSTFHDSIIINGASSGDIRFGIGGGKTTLDTSIIIIGSSGFSSSGILHLGGILQNDATKSISLTTTGTTKLEFANGSIWYGTVTASAPYMKCDGGRFLGVTDLTYTMNNTSASDGGTYFGGVTILSRNATGSGTFSLGTTYTDTFATTTTIQNLNAGTVSIANAKFDGKVIFKNQSGGGTDRFFIAEGGTCTFKDSVTFDNTSSGMRIGSGGSAVFDTSSRINILSTFTNTFKVYNVTQNGTSAVNFPFQNNTDILSLNSGNTFSGPVSIYAQRVQLNSSTFNNTFYLKRTGSGTDTCMGGNVFNGTTTTIIDSNSTTHSFSLARTYADDFNGNVTFKQYGTNCKLYPAYTKNSTFAGDVIVDGSSAIEFGANGGKVIFDGNKGQSISKTGSYVPSIKKIEINSHNGLVSLSYPLTLADSLTLVSGVLISDATNLLTVADNIIVSGGTDSSFIYGPVKKIGNDAFTFPLGDTSIVSGKYHPLGISAPSTTVAAYTAQYFAQGQTLGSTKVDSIGYISTCEYWTLNRNADTCQVKPTLWWNSNSCNVDTSLQRVAYYNSTQWVSLGKGTLTGNPTKGSIAAAANVNLFGTFTLAQLCNITADISSSHGGTICAGVSDTITATPSGLTSYQFFKNGSSVQTGSSDKYISSSLTNGDVIKVKATNFGSCLSYDSITIVVNFLPSVSITTDSTTFCKGQTHTLTASGTGLTSYLWTGGATTSTRPVSAAGTYTVTVSNGTCSNTTSQVISLYDTIQPTITVIGSPIICTGNNSDLQADLSGAVNYLWSTTETTSLITVEDSATYQVTCLDAHGCYVHNWQVITQANAPDAPIVTPSGVVNLCTADEGETVSSEFLHVENYDSDLLWSTSESTQDIEVNYEDIFLVTYTDPVSGCYSLSSPIITVISTNSIPPDSITTNKPGNEICKGDSITITKHGGVLGEPLYAGDTDSTYWGWYIGSCGDSLVGTGDSITVHPTDDTRYYLRADGPCGTVCDSLMVYCMNISMSVSDVTCPGYGNGRSSVEVSGGTKPYSYEWSPKVGGSFSIWGLSAGYHRVVVTDSLGCSLSDSVLVNNPDSIHVSIVVTPSDCHDSTGTAKITATGGAEIYTFFWIPDGLTKDSIGGLPAGVYAVTVTDQKGCSVDTSAKISDSDGPISSVEVTNNVSCNGYNDASIIINLCPGCLPTDPLPLCRNAAGNTERLAAGYYPIIITDSLGCITIVEATITEPLPLSLNISTTQSLCGDSSGSATAIVIGGSGNYTYLWSSGGNDSLDANISSGFDTITVTDENGCVAMGVALVTDSDGPNLTTSSTNLSCFDSAYGEVTVLASGGSSPYEYLWYDIGQTSSSVDSLYEGTFNVLVTDSLGCKQKATAAINSPPPMNVKFYFNPATSDSSFDGNAHVEVQGGVLPYEYIWLPDSQATAAVRGLGIDTISIYITDGNGCSTSKMWPGQPLQLYTCPVASGGAPDNMDGCDFTFDPCPTHSCTTLTILQFGAIPNDNLSDECAFELANKYINQWANSGIAPGATFTLEFPAGTYDIGRQTLWGEYAWINGVLTQNLADFAKPHNIFYLENINGPGAGQHNPIVFKGIPALNGALPKFRFMDCMRFGAFVPIGTTNASYVEGDRYLMVGEVLGRCQMAGIGTVFITSCSNDITIENLELDGNITNMAVGGGNNRAAGIELNHGGILVAGDAAGSCGSYDITIDNVNVHDFGYGGIGINSTNNVARVNLVMRDSKFNNNGCCGFFWAACSGVRAYNCEFNNNAHFITTLEASGMDIEGMGVGTYAPTLPLDGRFIDCKFNYNYRAGAQCQDNNYYGFNDYGFTRCTFVGSELSPWERLLLDGNPIVFKVPKTHFDCCDLYGQITYAYSSYNDQDKMVFNLCSFNEEYIDVSAGKTWAFNIDCSYDINDCSPTGNSGQKSFMLQLGNQVTYRRVTFNQCKFNTNFGSAICRLNGGLSGDEQKVINCDFFNRGLNDLQPNVICGAFNTAFSFSKLFWFEKVNFIGRNTLTYCRDGGCDVHLVGPDPFGNTRNRTNRDDYNWYVTQCLRNGLASNVAISGIFDSYYMNNCVQKTINWIPPFAFNDVTVLDELNYLPCQERFTQLGFIYPLTPLKIWSDQSYPITESISLSCSGVGNRLQQFNKPITDKVKLTAAPIPTVDFLKVNNINFGDIVCVFDVYGNLLMKQEAKTTSLEFDLRDISPGVYFIKSPNSNALKIIKAY